MIIFRTRMESQLGPLLLSASEKGLASVEFEGSPRPVTLEEGHPLLDRAARQLREYFSGERRAFDLPLDPQGTDFQRTVWQALTTIPYGETLSYAALAARLDRPRASRAVGAANGRNPLPIILPCHRVIGTDGSLTGYSGGLAIKRFLLQLEGAPVMEDLFASEGGI